MADLTGVDLGRHLSQIFNEFKQHQSVYGYAARSFYYPDAGTDCSVQLYGSPAATPLGPAAGPHTQLAQNILLSWLHGSRIIELKTIQILDDLDIPRPCIDMRNIGFNVEWSQELSLTDSLREYVTAWMLIHLIRHSELLGIPAQSPFYHTIFDMSAGYDLKGISSNAVSGWLKEMQNAGEIIESLRAEIPVEFSYLKQVDIPAAISDSLTLSTFHGCPADEIEDIVTYLITELHLNVIVKMNPTLGGHEFTRTLLQNTLGYEHVELEPSAFEEDLQFDQAVEMMRRLQTVAEKHHRVVGAKFTNTLVVKNNETVFKEPQRYLSGAPLYVLAMSLADKFRKAVGADFPLSFSGGINKNNFAEAVAANLVPVTTCTDLLKKGGYKKLTAYLHNLQTAMKELNAATIPEFIIKSAPQAEDIFSAGAQNSSRALQRALSGTAYHVTKNAAQPKKINSQLSTFDCLSCNICIPVCPNAANFEYNCQPLHTPVQELIVQNGQTQRRDVALFTVQKNTQIGNLAEFCNACGNCDTFCPESGGPFLAKPRFFIYRSTFEAESAQDGYYFENSSRLLARRNGELFSLTLEENTIYCWEMGSVLIRFDEHGNLLSCSGPEGFSASTRIFWEMKVIFDGIRSQPQRYPHHLLLQNR